MIDNKEINAESEAVFLVLFSHTGSRGARKTREILKSIKSSASPVIFQDWRVSQLNRKRRDVADDLINLMVNTSISKLD